MVDMISENVPWRARWTWILDRFHACYVLRVWYRGRPTVVARRLGHRIRDPQARRCQCSLVRPSTTSSPNIALTSAFRISYLGGYVGLVVLMLFVFVCAQIVLTLGALRASKLLHRKLIETVLGTTLRWLDKTPASRIITRCTQDVSSGEFPSTIFAIHIVLNVRSQSTRPSRTCSPICTRSP